MRAGCRARARASARGRLRRSDFQSWEILGEGVQVHGAFRQRPPTPPTAPTVVRVRVRVRACVCVCGALRIMAGAQVVDLQVVGVSGAQSERLTDYRRRC